MAGMGRRAFLTTSAGVVGGGAAIQRGFASSGHLQEDIDFEQLVRSVFESVPDGTSELRNVLADLAGLLRENLAPFTPDAIGEAIQSVSKASSAARRLKYGIEILHNNDIAQYLDDAWVVAFRNKIGVITRFLPLVGSFNNLYGHARTLDKAVQNNWILSDVNEEKFELFGYSLAAFCLEVGLWYVGAPYKMAWKGTRFVSNRTLLRGINYLDNRVVALLMSEIHWKIRETLYESINADNVDATVEELSYYMSRFDGLQHAARDYELRNESASYIQEVDVSISRSDLRQFDFIGATESQQSSDDDEWLEGWLDGIL